MSTDAKTATFKKDKNNNLTEKQCEVFIKDYKEYKNGKILKINNPKTNKSLNDEDRIKYIYNICKKKLELDSESPKPKSKSKSKSPEPEDYEIILDSYNKVQDIIFIPLNTLAQNKALIASLFTKPIKYEVGLWKLCGYLDLQPEYMQNIYVKSYHNILREINMIIRRIYNYKDTSRDILTKQYNWKLNYKYNPFAIPEITPRPNIIDAIKTTKKILKNMWANTNYLNTSEIRCLGLNIEPINELKKILFYSQTNKNKEDIIRNLDDNMDRYMALQFILVLIRDEMSGNVHFINKNGVNSHLEIIDSLVTKNIINTLFNNNDDSISISKSISWSGTPRSSSSGHSHFQSKANIERYKKTKAELVREITENNINDTDPYLAESWEDMSLNKLKNVISLKYKEGGNTYSVAFYIRTLYQAWRNAIKDRADFKNPYTRKEFTENDKEDIMNAMTLLYPKIQRPKLGEGRRDISIDVSPSFNGTRAVTFKFQYIIKLHNRSLLVPIISFTIPLNFNVDVEPAYIQQYLFDNIVHLSRNKKLFGKNMPLKPLDVLLEYNNETLNNYDEYKDFFDKIKNAL